MIVFLILNIPRLFLLGFEVERILKFRTCMVSSLTCFFIAMIVRINFKLNLNLKKNLCATFDVV